MVLISISIAPLIARAAISLQTVYFVRKRLTSVDLLIPFSVQTTGRLSPTSRVVNSPHTRISQSMWPRWAHSAQKTLAAYVALNVSPPSDPSIALRRTVFQFAARTGRLRCRGLRIHPSHSTTCCAGRLGRHKDFASSYATTMALSPLCRTGQISSNRLKVAMVLRSSCVTARYTTWLVVFSPSTQRASLTHSTICMTMRKHSEHAHSDIPIWTKRFWILSRPCSATYPVHTLLATKPCKLQSQNRVPVRFLWLSLVRLQRIRT